MGIQRLLWVLSIVFPLGNSFAQEKCATVEVTENRRNRFLLKETDEQFEDWINKRRLSGSGRINASGEYTIPVVFHIVHNGEAVGTGVNISDEQVISQIEVLNRDFTRTNADASSTPSEFQSVAGSLNIKFVLATQDPNGEATQGIVRVKGSKSQWSTNDEGTLKSQSYWPAEDYLNIWVTNISSNTLGYAQFPVSDLAGLESAEDNRLTDGVVIDYTVVGSNEDGSFNLTSNFNKGRTTTHEVGHFFGLRHIWGDDNGSCSGNGDYVADTPNQGNSTSGCPSHPQTSCSVHTMFQNYMDYTNDICMNLFTVEQVERMITVLENSPRRASLLNSRGAEPLSPVENDIAILSISSPIGNVCEAKQVPVLAVQNNGLNNITDVEIEVSVNGNEQRVDVGLSQSFAPGQTTSLYLDALTLNAGDNVLSFQIVSTNGFSDGKSGDNFIETSVYFPHATSLPFTEDFASLSDQWKNVQSGTVNWTVTTAPKESGSNTALYLNFFNATTTVEPRVLFSPTFVLPEDGAPYLVFDIAYAQSSSSKNDGLKVFVVSDCSDYYLSGKEVFYKSGPDLSTASIINSSFKPAGDSDWSHNAVDLSDFKGQRDLRLAFVGINAGGNNIYIDNVRVVENVAENVSITEVLSPTPAQCETGTTATFTVFNEGVSALNSVKVACYLNGEFVVLQTFSGLQVAAGEATKLSIPGINLIEGENHLSLILQEPNGLFDVDTAENDISVYSVWNNETDIIPLLQNFKNGLNAWTVVSPFGGNEWSFAETNYGPSLYFAAGSDDASSEGWLVSPSLDLSTTSVASVMFDVFYSATPSGVSMSSKEKESETFKVLVSVDCGAAYSDTVWSETYNGSGSNTVNEPPDSESQWRRIFIDLSSFAGQGSVRLAFVTTDFTDANVYLDNVEFFLSDDSTAVETELPYAVYGTDPSSPNDFYITFNLPERQAINYSIIDLNGRQIIARQLENVLNQTFQIEPNVSAGMYILRLQIGTQFYATRVYLN